ncbi:hypothetical protein HY439_03840 [Candidatus Microgenomates bacterium]|nr:hypothetical protein [Candidatus Microgenomates bacterium]
MKKISIKRNRTEIIFIITALIFSFWLMTATFGSDPNAGTITIAGKAYSDFAANIPLIRSFSWGENFPPEYPLFPGEPIRYHFLFYLLVGTLEKIGIPLGWALNLPSILGFFSLLLMIYFLAKTLFKSILVAVLSAILFLFNGSFGFYYFFQKHPLSFPQTILDIAATQSFSAFGPYDKNPVTAFWNLNIYTNQRHFASGLFFALLPLYLFLRASKKKRPPSIKVTIALGLILGLLPFWHATAFIIFLIMLAGIFLFLPFKRQVFLIALIGLFMAFPQFLYLTRSQNLSSLHFHPGYLIANNLSITSFLQFWFLNLGLSSLLIPLGVFLAPPKARKIFWIILPVFIIGNLFQFSPDIAVNHKFFNFFLLVGNIFTAFLLSLLWRKNYLTKVLTLGLLFFLTLSGIIDFFAIRNDHSYTLDDAPRNPDIVWIKENTPSSSIFLNSSFLYHPASLAGRKIFLGWPYFTWSAGYDTNKRGRIFRQLYQETTLLKACQDLKENSIDYITEDRSFANPDLPPISLLFRSQFTKLYENKQTSFTIYGRQESCHER